MSNKNSHLLNGVSAGVLAAVFFFLNAVSGILNSLWAWFLPIMLVLIIIVVFGKDIMAAINGAMEAQAESLVDQLLR